MTTYTILAQLSQDFRRQGLVETAAAVDAAHEQFVARYGAPESLRVVPRLPYLQELVRILQLQRQRALEGDQYGRRDFPGALTAEIALSVLAQALNSGESVTLADANSFISKLRREVAAAFERIETSRALEAGKARFLREQRWQEEKRRVLGEQKRQRELTELQITKQRLEQALGQ
jgi:hypothetical protein